jgi:hypothetical protein
MADYLLSPEEKDKLEWDAIKEHFPDQQFKGIRSAVDCTYINLLLEAQHKKTTEFWNGPDTEHPIPDGQVIVDGNKIPHYHDGDHWYYTHRWDCPECRKIMEE